jgi:hypothetical protein
MVRNDAYLSLLASKSVQKHVTLLNALCIARTAQHTHLLELLWRQLWL